MCVCVCVCVCVSQGYDALKAARRGSPGLGEAGAREVEVRPTAVAVMWRIDGVWPSLRTHSRRCCAVTITNLLCWLRFLLFSFPLPLALCVCVCVCVCGVTGKGCDVPCEEERLRPRGGGETHRGGNDGVVMMRRGSGSRHVLPLTHAVLVRACLYLFCIVLSRAT